MSSCEKLGGRAWGSGRGLLERPCCPPVPGRRCSGYEYVLRTPSLRRGPGRTEQELRRQGCVPSRGSSLLSPELTHLFTAPGGDQRPSQKRGDFHFIHILLPSSPNSAARALLLRPFAAPEALGPGKTEQLPSVAYQYPLIREVLQASASGESEDHGEGFVWGLSVAKLHLILGGR